MNNEEQKESISKVKKLEERFKNSKLGIALDTITGNHTNAYAASIAFFFILSLIPALMVLCTILPYTNISKEYLISFFLRIIPDIFSDTITGIINDIYVRAATILPVASIFLLWTACKGAMAMMDAMNTIYQCESRNYLLKRLIASIYTLLVLIVIILALFLVIVGNDIVNFLLRIVPQFTELFHFIMNLRYSAAFIVLTLLFSVVYFLMPNRRQNLFWQMPGAVITSLFWVLFSVVFSIFLNRFNLFSIYGSLSIIITLMMWLYFCMYFALIGANINKYLEPLLIAKREKKKAMKVQKRKKHKKSE